jgi:hypothetical protein
MNIDRRILLEKLIAIQAWNRDCYTNFYSLAQEPEKRFYQQLVQLEALLRQARPEQESVEALETLKESPHCLKLYQLAVATKPLLELFQKEPFFKEQDAASLQILIRLAAVKPDSSTAVQVDDPIFMRIITNWVIKGLPVTAETVLREDIGKILRLFRNDPELLHVLYQAVRQNPQAGSAQLQKLEQMLQSIERATDPKSSNFEVQINELSPTFKRLAVKIREAYQTGDQSMLALWLEPPMLSAMSDSIMLLPKLEKAFQNLKNEAAFFDFQDERQAVSILMEDFPKNDIQPTDKKLTLRIEVAEYYIELRKFAKLQTFIFCWPEYTELLQSNFSAIKNIDSKFYQPEFELTPYEEQIWEKLKQKKQVARFMGMAPHFWNISAADLQNYLAITSVALVMPLPTTPETMKPPLEQAWVKGEPLTEKPTFQNIELAFLDYSETGCKLELNAPYLNEPVYTQLNVNWAEILEGVNFLFSNARYNLRSPIRAVEERLSVLDALRQAGQLLHKNLFDGNRVGDELQRVIEKDNARLVLKLDRQVAMINQLPWEALYITQRRLFPALSQRYSLVRLIRASPISTRPFLVKQPLRILAVLATPNNLPRIDIEQEANILQQALMQAQESGLVQLQLVMHATPEQLLRELRRFQPHLCHVVSHADFDQERNTGFIVLEDANQGPAFLNTSQLTNLLSDSDLRAIILNGCFTGSYKDDLMTSLAGSLVDAGVPVVIATTRAVIDTAALLFAREFYLAFAEGYNIERSLTEARKRLSIEQFDWSIYALFANTTELDLLKMATLQERSDISK